VPELIQRFQRVIATDISVSLLSLATQSPKVTFAKAPAEDSGLEGQSVDLAIVARAIHWFDLPCFRRELDRVPRPHAVFAFRGYNWPQVYPRVDGTLNELRAGLQPFWPERSVLLHSEYRSVEAFFDRIHAPVFEMDPQRSRQDYLAHVDSWSAVRYGREAGHNDLVAQFQSMLGLIWPDGRVTRVRCPRHLRVYRNQTNGPSTEPMG
jgi:hypothetical protein